MRKSVGIIGASGLLGIKLAREYEAIGWEVVRFSRVVREEPSQTWKIFSPETLAGLNVLVNLAGERIDTRWTEKNKKRFWVSRVGVTECIAQYISGLPEESRPQVWVNASAVGIYGGGGDSELDEASEVASGYLADLCDHWEKATNSHVVDPCRVVQVRIGVVLGRESAAWRKMVSVFKLGIGGRLGSGQQWFPWVHLDDIVGAIIHLVKKEDANGPYNIVAPEQLRNVEFTQALAQELRRPACFPVPVFALRIVLGEFAGALLSSQRVKSQKLSDSGYKWRYPDLKSALSALNSK
ncbi:TIGR01777 family oxidoreductase [Rubritalea sp.]|uniref:TIGR01777 family oxidoreductase n=1 Tax=Rubritalea sp. TaxID=2109375 RepID=UPI003EF9C2D7